MEAKDNNSDIYTLPLKELLKKLNKLKIELWLEGESLGYKAPKGTVTDELLALIKKRKEEIIESLLMEEEKKLLYEPIKKVEEKDYYPLSEAQRRMYLLYQMDKGSTAYNITNVLKIEGNCDKEKIENIFMNIMKRHESLRTSFELIDDEPVQRIHNSVVFNMEYEEISHNDEEFENLMKGFVRPFNLACAPLFRLKLLKLWDNTYYLLFDIHHIISDGVSASIFVWEFNTLYDDKTLQAPHIHYKDYCAWHERLLCSKLVHKKREHWLQSFKGELPVLYLPVDYKRPTEYSFKGDSIRFCIPKGLAEGLNSLARKNKATLFTVLISAYYILLSKYTGQSDIIIGSPVAGRTHLDVLNTIGMFVDTLPLRNYPSPQKTYNEFLHEVTVNVLMAFDNQEYPFEAMIEDIGIERDLGRNPLFDTVFVLQNMTIDDIKAKGLQIKRVDYNQKTAQFDITIRAIENKEGIDFEINYCVSLFAKETMQKLGRHFVKILQEIVDNPQSKLRDINMMSQDEVYQIIDQFNHRWTKYPMMKTIHGIFEEQAKKTPHNIAVYFQGTYLTYRELNVKANQLARVIKEKMIQNTFEGPKIVAIMLEPSINLVVCALGVLKAGCAYLPIDPDYPQERIKFMLEDSGAGILISEEEIVAEVGFQGKTIYMHESIYEGSEAESDDGIRPDNLAYIIYTSGTTGRPKGVMIEHRNVVRLFFNDKKLFDFNEEDVWTMFHSFCFDFSVWEMYGALLYGGKLVIVPRNIAREPEEYLNLLKEQKVTVLNQTPTAFSNLIDYEMKSCEKELCIRYIIFGGEALKPAILKPWKERYPQTRLINMYGITETTVHVTYKEIGSSEIESNISNIGRPIPTLTVYIMDGSSRLLPVGIPGELCVGGEGVSPGYLNRPELTREKFIQNPYNTEERLYKSGDLARFLPNGEMEYLGRIDHQVKIRGHRIELGEIESSLIKHPQIREVIVISREMKGQNYLCGYIVSDIKIKTDELRAFLKEELPDYMIPSYFIYLEKMPLTINGKVDRKSLPLVDGGIDTGEAYIGPENEAEEKMAEVWKKVLGLNRVGVNQNFFTLGGDSIKAVKLISRINNVFNTNMRIKDIYLHQSIKALINNLDRILEASEDDIKKGHFVIDEIKKGILEKSGELRKLPQDTEDFYPLSQIQQGMIFYSKLRPEEPIYHDQFPYHIKFVSFRQSVYLEAVDLVIKKHPILRTTFELENFTVPLQIVHKDMKPSIIIEDVSCLPALFQEQRIKTYMKEDMDNKFKFENELLWRMRIFKLNDNDYCILLSFQHAVLDGWSVATLMSEILQNYKRLVNGEDHSDPTLKCSYKDYVAANLGRKVNEASRKFWADMLRGYSRTKLPFNISSKRINSETGSKIYKKPFKKELLKSLQQKAKEYQCTLKDICLSAHVYLMAIVTTEKDIVTGVVTHERPPLEDSEKVLGCFLNSVPIRIKVEKMMDKLDLINRIKEYQKNVKAHELFLGDISNILGEVNNNGNPIFDTLFNYTDFHVMENIRKEEIALPSEYKLDIKSKEMTNTLFDLEVSRTLDDFELQIKYSPGFFCSEDIETAARLYERILEKFTNTEGTITGESLITEEEMEDILFGFNDTIIAYDRHKKMHELFQEQAEKFPDSVALVLKGKTLTYGKLDEMSNRLAHLLILRGVKSGDHVALISQRNFEMIIGMLGILKAGGAYVPIDSDYPLSRKEYIVKNSNVSTVVTDGEYDLIHKNTVVIDYIEMEAYPACRTDVKIDSRQLAYVIYTSGSTGNPKGVMIEHHSAVNLISWVNREFNVNKDDRLLFITSMCFDLSVYDIFGILAAGGSIVIASKEQVGNPSELKTLIKNEKITFWDSVPSTMNYLVNSIDVDEGFIQKDLRLVFMSGDWIPVKLPQRIRDYFPNAKTISLGGATEGTVWSIYYPIEEVNILKTSIPYGKPIDNNYFYILDENKCVVPPGVAGELYIGGVGVARGYMNDKERTEASFVPNRFLKNEMMYKTGDLGRMMRDGNIEFLGRTDYQVKIRGFRVELGEIENQLLKHVEIKEAVVVDRTDNSGSKYLAAYIVGSKDLSAPKLREYLSSRLPDYIIPDYFVHLDSMPLTFNGKIARKEMPDPAININCTEEYEAPGNEVEEKLVEIWKEVLEIDRIGVNNNFFDLGGHSLKAITMVTKIHKLLNAEVPLAEIFERQTIRELANYITRGETNLYSSILPVEKREYYELSSAQKRLYIIEQLKKSSSQKATDTSYNITSAVIAEGQLDIQRIEKVLGKIVSRHEAFRTSFEIIDEKPVQRIHDSVDFCINMKDTYIDLEGNSIEIKIKSLVNEFIRPFDLSRAPLLRASVVKLGQDKHILMFDMHHIISDGVSMGILLQEFNSLYEGHELPLPVIQYKDFSHWQNNNFKTVAIRRQEEFWLEMFLHGVPRVSIPADFPRPDVQSHEGAEFRLKLDLSLSQELLKLASETGTTMYMVLLAAFNILLHKSTGEEDIVVGTSIAGRNHADLQKVVGMFVNMLAMRNYPKADNTFEEFLINVRENTLKAFENQDYQFEMIVDKLGLERDTSRNPMFDVAFVLQNTDMGNMAARDVKFTPYILESSISKFDLTLYAWETSGGIDFIFEYNRGLFKNETIEELSRRFSQILKAIARNRGIKIKDIMVYDKAGSISGEIHRNQRDIVIDVDF